MTELNPTSPKVTAASLGAAGGAGAGAVVSTLVLWIIGVSVPSYGVPADANHVGDAIAAVPSPIAGAILLVLSIVGAYVSAHRAGWLTVDPLRIVPGDIPAGFDDGSSLPDAETQDGQTALSYFGTGGDGRHLG